MLKMQGDGNLVFYDGSTALWNSNTAGIGAGAFAVMQTDGNFVVYNSGGHAKYNAHITPSSGSGNYLKMQGDKSLVIYSGGGSIVKVLHQGPNPPPSLTRGEQIVAAARSQIGLPYSWGGGGWQGPSYGFGPDGATFYGFDCSGLAQYAVYQGTALIIARTSEAQYLQGTPITLGNLQPGDLVFFDSASPGHVGIYEGNGMMIDAPHPGAYLREEPMWMTQYVGARRF